MNDSISHSLEAQFVTKLKFRESIPTRPVSKIRALKTLQDYNDAVDNDVAFDPTILDVMIWCHKQRKKR